MAKRRYAGPECEWMRFTLALAVALLASGCGAEDATSAPTADAPRPQTARVGRTPQGRIEAVVVEDCAELPPGDCQVIDIGKQRANGAYDAFGDVNQAPYLK